MTIEDKLKEILDECGMPNEQANRVIKKVKNLECNKVMAGRWQDDMEGYLSSLLAALWLSTRKVALEDIDENCPRAWFRGMFTNKAQEVTHNYQRGQALLAIAIVLLIIVFCIFFAALATGLGGG